jgi:hypothetical protein
MTPLRQAIFRATIGPEGIEKSHGAHYARFKFSIINIHRVRVRAVPPHRDSNRLMLPRITEEETALTTRSDEARARAEASFRKEERAKEGASAMLEYQANSRLVREKIERLRALRLAKEAADKERTPSSSS